MSSSFTRGTEPSLSHTVRDGGGTAVQIPREGTMVGRYLVIEQIGSGGAGVVLRAYDPRLHREVALKLLHDGAISGEARKRMAREGQAMARLSHPNVVAVYDVEVGTEGVVLVMELVRGTTLGQWMRAEKRSWQRIVSAFVEAGRGLEAAHGVGLLHRDFKPGNVLVGDDGRILVTDFGLARMQGGLPGGPTFADADYEHPVDQNQLTQTGAFMGTPLYMSPEQYVHARAIDARSDQYAFCVSLWYALVGTPPFERDGELSAEAKRLGAPKWPKSVAVPGRIVRAIRRGLEPEPASRWPSMGALLSQLERGQRSVAYNRVWIAMAGLAVVAVGVESYRRWERSQRVVVCEQLGATIADNWNNEVAEQTRQGLLATGVGFAESTASNVLPLLDEYARAWQSARTHACMRSDVEDNWSQALAEASRWCLDGRRMQFAALIEQMRVAEVSLVHTAIPATLDLPSTEPCVDPSVLQRLPLPTPEKAGDVEGLLGELARAEALRASQRPQDALRLARDAWERSKAVGWGPLRAQAQMTVGLLLRDVGRYEDSYNALIEAYFAASEDAPEVAADASLQLVSLLGEHLKRTHDGEVWARFAKEAIARIGADAGMREAMLANALGLLSGGAGRYAEARDSFRGSVEMFETRLAPDHLLIATPLQNLGTLQMQLGEYQAAKVSLERARDIYEAALGSDHPDVAICLNNLGVLHDKLAEYVAAKDLHRQVLRIRENALGGGHPLVGMTLNNLGSALKNLGEYEAAVSLHARARAVLEKSLGPDHPDVATTLNNLGAAYYMLEDLENAKATYLRALQIREQSLGPNHAQVATTLNNLGRAYLKAGDHDTARSLLERALEIRERELGPDHVRVAVSLNGLAMVELERGRVHHARELYERSLAIGRNALGDDHPDVAPAYMGLGDVALALGDRRLAISHFERAAEIFRKALGDEHPYTAMCVEKLREASKR